VAVADSVAFAGADSGVPPGAERVTSGWGVSVASASKIAGALVAVPGEVGRVGVAVGGIDASIRASRG